MVKYQCLSVATSLQKTENFFSLGSLAILICDQEPFVAAAEHSKEDVRQKLEDDQVGGVSFVYNSDALHR